MKRWQAQLIGDLKAKLGRPLRSGDIAQAVAAYVQRDDFQSNSAIARDECAASQWSAKCSVYLGFFGSEDAASFLKIGIARDVAKRMAQHRISNPMLCTLSVWAEFPSRSIARDVEVALLRHMKDERARGEWVNCRASLPACRAIAESLAEVASQVSGAPVVFAEH